MLEAIQRGMSADKLKKGDVGLKDIFQSVSFHQCTTHIHSFITDEIWTGKFKKSLINNAVKIQLTKNVEKKYLKSVNNSFEVKVIYNCKTYPFPIIF